MKITIANLYYDLLNLYGESGNIKAIKKALENQKIKVEILNLSINDNLDFSKYDFVYMGSGTEYNQSLVLKHIMKYKNEIKNYIEDNKFILITGNSIELFGKHIIDNKKIKCLSIFDYTSTRHEKRIIKETLTNCDFIKKSIIGFENHNCHINDNNYESLFIDSFNNKEGIKYKNFYGTYLLGPLLIRNPELLKFITMKLISNKNNKFKIKKFDFKIEEKAYNTYVKYMTEKKN